MKRRLYLTDRWWVSLAVSVLIVIGGAAAVPIQAADTGGAGVGATDRAVITQVQQTTVDGRPNVVYHLRFLSGPQQGKTVVSGDNGGAVIVNNVIFHKGDKVFVTTIDKYNGGQGYVIQDLDRRGSLWWLAGLFLLVIIWFSRWHGLRSVLGLVFSFVVIIGWAVPQIAEGANPVMISLLSSAAVLIVGFLITEGLTRLAWASIVGTIITMTVIGLLSWWSIGFTRLTGNGSEEAFYLQSQTNNSIDVRGLLLAGIIIGTLGILEDVAVSQVATIGELRSANPRLKRWELYQAGMRVGRTHLAAIINTLTLAYAGSALPLLLLFHLNAQPAAQTLNGELVATEIVRSIIGSIGLILALPITTVCAVLLNVRGTHGHSHGSIQVETEPPRVLGRRQLGRG